MDCLEKIETRNNKPLDRIILVNRLCLWLELYAIPIEVHVSV